MEKEEPFSVDKPDRWSSEDSKRKSEQWSSRASALEKSLKPKTGTWNSKKDAFETEVRSENAITAGLVIREERKDLTDDEFDRLRIRRRLELELIKKFDVTEINNRRECWFIVDCMWLNAWAEFVQASEDDPSGPPGQMSTKDLLDEKGQPLPGLVAKIDYRAVCPNVYFILANLHGKDSSYPDICRYTTDIYLPPVPPEALVNIYLTAENEAKFQANKIRTQWVKWELEEEDDEDETLCCGYITKEHILACLYWAASCWRKGDGRQKIKYSDYKPLAPPGLDSSAHSMIHEERDVSSTAADSGYNAVRFW